METNSSGIQRVIPLCCFPSAHWMLLAMSEDVIIDIHENYAKQTFRNRFEILTVNGRLSLTIPVVGQKGQKIPISELQLFGDKWRREFWNTIKTAYGRAAYFEYYGDELKELILGEQQSLLEFNKQALIFISKTLKIPTKAAWSDAVLDRTNTKKYNFLDRQFEPDYEWAPLPSYLQVFADRLPFESNLSVLDLMMTKGPATLEYLLFIKNSEYISQ